LSDVDGTLVGSDKSLSEATVDAVARLGEAGIAFAVTSGRPPRGMSMLVEPLGLTTPIAAFNGGEFVTPGLEEIRTMDIPQRLIPGIIEVMDAHGMDAWVYSGADWYVLDPEGPHVDRESATVQFEPTAVDSYEGISPVAKVVGVGDDHDSVKRAEAAAREAFGDHVSASRSQPYYLDVTHPEANKGGALRFLAEHLDIPGSSVATLGDSANDVLMFAHCGLSIAMGNADPGVQRAARRVTGSNDDDGWAEAINRFVLGDP
jgi:hypothetical protein